MGHSFTLKFPATFIDVIIRSLMISLSGSRTPQPTTEDFIGFLFT